MRIADALAKDLSALGVGHVFSVTGGGSIHLNDAIYRAHQPSLVYCHHEQAAAYGAEAYARATSNIGVCLVTLGPGASNAVTGQLCALMDSVPVLFVSGQSFSSQRSHGKGLRQLGVQEFDVVSMIEKYTKFSEVLLDPSRYRETFDEAISCMLSDRPGPAWLEIPVDIQHSECDRYVPSRQIRFVHSRSRSRIPLACQGEDWFSKVAEVKNRLLSSSRPLLLLGQGVRLAGAHELTAKWLKGRYLPFMLTHNALDLVPHDYRGYVGFPGLFGNRAANLAIQASDFLLVVGSRLSFGQTGYDSQDFARDAFVAMVDIDPLELNKTSLRLDLKIESDAHEFLSTFLPELGDYGFSESQWFRFCTKLRKKFDLQEIVREVNSISVNSYNFVRQLSDRLQPGDTVVTDMGLAYQSTYQALFVGEGVRVITNTGFAPMGWGLPAAIGAALGRRGRVYCLTGDGGLMMNLQELATLRYLNLPVVVVIYNNKGYLTIRQTQENLLDGRLTGVNSDSGITFPDFLMIATAFGLPSTSVRDNEHAVDKIFEELEKTSGPLIVDVQMSPEQLQGPRLISRRLPDGRILPSRLEDMWPFLDQNELLNILDEGKRAR